MSFMTRYLAIACLFGATLLTQPAKAAEEYQFDTSHSRLLFLVNHAGFSDFMIMFKEFEGTIMLDFEHPEQSMVGLDVMIDSVDTELPDFDQKLKGEQFFNAALYPKAQFKSTNVEVTGENTANVTGNLTLRGVTKPMTLAVTLNKHGYDKWRKSYKVGLSIRGSFKRSEWEFDTYIPVVGDEITVMMEAEVERPLKEGESY